MKTIIFGINGQDGYYLKEICQQKEIEVIGVSRSSGNWTQGDVSNFNFVEKLIKKEKPDYIFHFAAYSTTKHEALFENHETISTGTVNILESVRCHSPESRVFITGSGVQFENKGKPIPKKQMNFERRVRIPLPGFNQCMPPDTYRSLGLKVYVGYLFHHESPLRKNTH